MCRFVTGQHGSHVNSGNTRGRLCPRYTGKRGQQSNEVPGLIPDTSLALYAFRPVSDARCGNAAFMRVVLIHTPGGVAKIRPG